MEKNIQKTINGIIKKYRNPEKNLILLLHDIQKKYNYLPEEGLEFLSEKIDVPLSNIFSIATFYKAFSTEPKGKTAINICVGTACYVKNSENLLKRFASEVDLEDEGTTDDLTFTIARVRCLGCCSLAPVVSINGRIHGELTADRVKKLIEKEA